MEEEYVQTPAQIERERKLAAGLCSYSNCEEPVEGGTTRCAIHREMYRQYQRTWVAKETRETPAQKKMRESQEKAMLEVQNRQNNQAYNPAISSYSSAAPPSGTSGIYGTPNNQITYAYGQSNDLAQTSHSQAPQFSYSQGPSAYSQPIQPTQSTHFERGAYIQAGGTTEVDGHIRLASIQPLQPSYNQAPQFSYNQGPPAYGQPIQPTQPTDFEQLRRGAYVQGGGTTEVDGHIRLAPMENNQVIVSENSQNPYYGPFDAMPTPGSTSYGSSYSQAGQEPSQYYPAYPPDPRNAPR